jgi:hypothetical protein
MDAFIGFVTCKLACSSLCRYASYLGATTEFSKWEGIAFDTKRRVMYAAITAVDAGMLKGEVHATISG